MARLFAHSATWPARLQGEAGVQGRLGCVEMTLGGRWQCAENRAQQGDFPFCTA